MPPGPNCRTLAYRRPRPNSAVTPPTAPPMAVPARRLAPPTSASTAPPRAAAPPLRRQRRDRLVDGRAGLRPELAERFEQLHPLFEADGEGVEVAHHVEVLIEGAVPLEAVVLIADAVDESHPGPSGPAQDLHLRLVVAPERPGAIHDVQHVRAGEDRREELALVGELLGALIRAKQLRHAGGTVRSGHLSRSEPRQGAGCVLEPGRVNQDEERAAVHAHRILADFGGGSRTGIDPNGIVFRERRYDARFPLVYPSHDREARRVAHGAAFSGWTAMYGSSSAARLSSQMRTSEVEAGQTPAAPTATRSTTKWRRAPSACRSSRISLSMALSGASHPSATITTGSGPFASRVQSMRPSS